MPSLFDNLLAGGTGGDTSREAQIRMMLAQAGTGGVPQPPHSTLPFAGLPTVPKSTMFDPNYLASLQQKVIAAPEPMLERPLEPPRMQNIAVGESLGMDDFNKGLRAAAGKKTDADKTNLERITDALKASYNAMARLYDMPRASASAASVSPQKKVYNPMQAPDTGEEMPPEMALEQYRYNLGNIRTSDNDWQGKTTPYRGFESFVSPEKGARAMFLNLRSYTKDPSMTLGTAIAKWAPKSENDTDAYIASVAKNAGIPADTPLQAILRDPQKAAAMMYAMGQIEHGRNFLPVFTPEFLAKVVSSVEAG